MTEPIEEGHTHGAEARIQTPSPEEAERMAEHMRAQGATNVTVIGTVVVVTRDPVNKF